MTEEELKQEAKDYVSTTASGMAQEMEIYERFYLASAEPREKRLAELEKENAELLGIIQGKDKVIQELEKENAELNLRRKKNK